MRTITLTAKTPKATLDALATEFRRQLAALQQDSIRATTQKESRYYAGRISQLNTVIDFIADIVVSE